MRKRVVLSLIVLMLLFSLSIAAEEITILHTNDSHGRILEDDWSKSLGFSKIATLVREIEKENPNTVILSAGDALHGQAIVNDFDGETVIRVFNQLGTDAMVAGNHDFNYGYQRLVELVEMADFPILSANVLKDGKPLQPPYTIINAGSVKIGILGITTPETVYKTHPKNVAGLKFADPLDTARKYLPQLQEECDLVIALTHLGLDPASKYTSELLAREVPGFDLIVDGHSHHFLPEGKEVNGTLIVSAGEYTQYLGRVDITYEEGEIQEIKVSSIPYNPEIADDPEMSKLISSYKEKIDKMYAQAVGKSLVVLNGERQYVRTGETNLGNLVADSMARAAGVKIAITNGGGIRASIDKGEITLGEVAQVLPFGNFIVVKELTGAQLKACLEHGVSAYPEREGHFLQVSGIKFRFDANKSAGERVIGVMVNGEPLDEDRVYQVATNDFMAAGGDGYEILKEAPTVLDTGIDMKDALLDLIKEKGEVMPVFEGRITRIPPMSMVKEVYAVKPGDTLSAIAEKFDISLQKLVEFNQILDPDLILPGQKIFIPVQ